MFKSALQQINAKVEGALGVMIVAQDGVIVDHISQSPEINLETLAAEFAAVLKSTRRFSRGSDLGHLQEVMVQTDRIRLLAKLITHEYYLLLVMDTQGNAGRAHHELRKAQLSLESEFTV